jgi:hypothetical protein
MTGPELPHAPAQLAWSLPIGAYLVIVLNRGDPAGRLTSVSNGSHATDAKRHRDAVARRPSEAARRLMAARQEELITDGRQLVPAAAGRRG